MPKKYSPGESIESFWSKVKIMGDDECWEWQASFSGGGYGRIGRCINKKFVKFLAHRLAYELLVGPIPEGMDLDHICNNRKCVNPSHLRIATRQQNCRNAKSRRPGMKGITWTPKFSKWRARIRFDGKSLHLGYFDTAEEAHAAYCAKAVELFGEFANFG